MHIPLSYRRFSWSLKVLSLHNARSMVTSWPTNGKSACKVGRTQLFRGFQDDGNIWKSKNNWSESVIDPKISIYQYYERRMPQKLCSDTVTNSEAFSSNIWDIGHQLIVDGDEKWHLGVASSSNLSSWRNPGAMNVKEERHESNGRWQMKFPLQDSLQCS
jgi:hypothetical protein